MAWGYWSATSVSDRGRSPRRDKDRHGGGVAASAGLYHQQASGNNVQQHQQQFLQSDDPNPSQHRQQAQPAPGSTAGVSLGDPLQGGGGAFSGGSSSLQMHQIHAELAAAAELPHQEGCAGRAAAPAAQVAGSFYSYSELAAAGCAPSVGAARARLDSRGAPGASSSPLGSDSVDYEQPGSSALLGGYYLQQQQQQEEDRGERLAEVLLGHAPSRQRLLPRDDEGGEGGEGEEEDDVVVVEGLSDVEFEDAAALGGEVVYATRVRQPSAAGGICLLHGKPTCRMAQEPAPPPPPPIVVTGRNGEPPPGGETQFWFDDITWVFPNVPPAPGMPCQGEDRSIYRRGARRWRKLYRVNGHIFQAKRFNRRAFCAYCQDRIWGLGRQGFKCIQCKLLVHKKCHKVVRKPCVSQPQQPSSALGESGIGGGGGGGGSGGGGPAAERNGEQTQPDSPQWSPHQAVRHDEDGAEAASAAEEQQQHAYRNRVASDVDGEELALDDVAGAEGASDRQYSLSDFELIRVIGRGSYAKVLMVELKQTKRIYAMKVIKKDLVTDDEDIDWVQTEKHVFETASNHPFLVGLHSCFQTPSRLFFVIEFVRGGDLMFHMQRQRRLPEEHARFYTAEISLALNFLHTKGIIYRDLKLDNVLLDHEGHVKLTDYGMCKEGVREGDTTATFCGTPNYIAPEILRGEDYGFSVDWWALGVLLYEMLAGRSPFDIAGASENPDQNTEDYLFQVILQKTIRIPRSLSVKAASVLKGFLCKDPAERLGCDRSSPNAFVDIMKHPFFKAIDWEMLEQKQVTPPYKPRLDSDRDLANFPPEFTDEPVHLTPDDPRVIDRIDQTEFEGFEYVNPLLMSLEDCV